MTSPKAIALWVLAVLALVVPLGAASFSPLLQYRQPVYIGAGFAGIAAFSLLLLQPLLAGRRLPGLKPLTSIRLHRAIGATIAVLVFAHIAGLWVTSPPDVIDVLLFRSPTPFSVWGALSMWAIIATALLAMFRKRVRFSPKTWRMVHLTLAVIIVITTALHALLIDGTMEDVSKWVLSILVLAATGFTVFQFGRKRKG